MGNQNIAGMIKYFFDRTRGEVNQIMHTMLSYVVKVDQRDKFYLTILTCCGHPDDICPPKNEQVQLTCLLL